jgi:hypothetical protein
MAGADLSPAHACSSRRIHTGEALERIFPPRFWIKANNFQELFEFLLYSVATIKFIYIEFSLDDIL